MRGSARRTVTRYVVAAVFCVSFPAWADGGRLAFVGAVAEATCAVAADGISGPVADGRRGCGGTAAGSLEPRAYVSIVTGDATAALASDRLIGYYAGYLAAAGAAGVPLLQTRTYE